MSAALIVLLVVLGLVVLVLARSVRIVPQARAAVIERLGRYVRTAGPGLTLLVPFVDRMRPLMDLREQVVSFPPQPVITSDNLTVAIDSVIYFQVTDPRSASYEIQNYIQAVEQLTITTLRNVVGSLNLEQALTSRDAINTQLRVVLDEATGPWGIRVARVEIKAIDPPPSIRDAMEQQMRADRNKRAIILQAEGQRESSIKSAEGQKASQILEAEGQKQAVILAAEAERQSRILRAEGDRAARFLTAQGQAKAIETTFAAIHDSKPDPAVMAYQYLQTLPQIAQGDANKMWIVPSEYGKALEGLGRLAAPKDAEGEDTPSWMQVGDGGERTADKIDTDGWFDSNLPAAADLPERVNLRASDDDAATREAHDALVEGSLAGAGLSAIPQLENRSVATGETGPDRGGASETNGSSSSASVANGMAGPNGMTGPNSMSATNRTSRPEDASRPEDGTVGPTAATGNGATALPATGSGSVPSDSAPPASSDPWAAEHPQA